MRLRVHGHVDRLRAWLVAADWLALGILTVGMVGIWGFLEIAEGVSEGKTRRFDTWLIQRFRQADDPTRPLGPIWFEDAVRDVTSLGSLSLLILVVGAVAGYLWIRRETIALALLFPTTIGGLLASLLLKAIFHRPRPELEMRLTPAYLSSFPSGHTMNSAVVYLTIGLILSRLSTSARIRTYVLSLATFLTVLVGLTRIYLGVHYPTDVAAGWAAGAAWMAIIWFLTRKLKMPRSLAAAPEVQTGDE